MSDPECGFVYVHGAGLDGWIWDDLAQLQDAPHLSASFPGRGNDPGVPKGTTLQAYVDHVREQIEEWPIERVVVVSHSIGGIVALEAISGLPDTVVGFVGLCAAVPKPGGSFLSCYPLHQRLVQRAVIRLVGTRPPDSAIRDTLCSGLSEEHTSRIITGFVPESRRLFTDERTAGVPDVPTLYVRTTNDRELPPSLQEEMIANLDADAVATIDSGHMPMLSNPRELADVLREFGRRSAP
jgi:pimeloyl-ACP methyl ester carboxylesterase